MTMKPIRYLHPKGDNWAETMVRCWSKDNNSFSGRQAETPIKGTLVDAEMVGDRVTCSQMGVELNLPFFGECCIFP